jgi:hypothetical protein
MDHVIHGARWDRFFFVSHGARKASFEQHTQCSAPEVFGQITLLGAPNDGGPIKFPDTWRNHRSAQRASDESRKDDGIGFPIKDRVNIYELDPPTGQLGPITRFAHVRFGPKQLRRLLYRFFEGEMFEGVQRVVVNKDSNGALFGKQVCAVLDCGAQSLQTQ